MTKLELARLIVTGMTREQLMSHTPRSTAHFWWKAWEAEGVTEAQQREMIARRLESRHTLGELQNWAEQETAP